MPDTVKTINGVVIIPYDKYKENIDKAYRQGIKRGKIEQEMKEKRNG